MEIEFTCSRQLWGRIPEPTPAKDNLPKWYKDLPGNVSPDICGEHDPRTIKKCMPVFDLLTTGWIMPLCDDVQFIIANEGTEVGCTREEGDIRILEFHHRFQVKGHPLAAGHPCKWINPWTIRTEPGISCLFIPPVQQEQTIFQVVPAIVDTDKFTNKINFPFFPTGEDNVYHLPKGMPLMQVIPFRRTDAAPTAVIRKETKNERLDRKTLIDKVMVAATDPSAYRNTMRDNRK